MKIRPAIMHDAHEIQVLVNTYASKGQMLQLSINDIYEKIFEFLVCEKDGEVIGVAALHPSWVDLAEIRSLVVNEKSQKKGIGLALVQAQLERAKNLGIPKVFTLTYSVDFFTKAGFKTIPMESLPKKIWTDCLKCVKFPECDETAMEIALV